MFAIFDTSSLDELTRHNRLSFWILNALFTLQLLFIVRFKLVEQTWPIMILVSISLCCAFHNLSPTVN